MKSIFFMIMVVLMVGCGRKEAPQAVVDAGPPEIVSIQKDSKESSVVVTVRLAGGAEGVGYQIERAELDPYCKCPSYWQRYHEEPTLLANRGKDLSKVLRYSFGKKRFYLYRYRAIDALGRLGPWSKVIWPPQEFMRKRNEQ